MCLRFLFLLTAVPARGGVEDRRDLDPAPPGRGPAAAAAAPPDADLGGPGPARGTARRDTQSPPPRIAAAGHPGHDPALAPPAPDSVSVTAPATDSAAPVAVSVTEMTVPPSSPAVASASGDAGASMPTASAARAARSPMRST